MRSKPKVDTLPQGSTKKPEGGLAEGEVTALKRACKANKK